MPPHKAAPSKTQTWRERWYEVIFEADTPRGKLFDVILLLAIFLSVLVVMLDSVEAYRNLYKSQLSSAEWIFTLLFTLEYGLRIACAKRPWRYVFSFYGVVDLLAILPTYLIAIMYSDLGMGDSAVQRLAVIRALRLLRTFRIFKLTHMLSEASALRAAIWGARAKVVVFLAFILIAVVIVGSMMHVIEGTTKGFESIPQSMYWAVVTMTTVGYGDIAPETAPGKALAAIMMVLGYSFIIVPTGIVSAELAHVGAKKLTTQVCPECMKEGHDTDASHCKYCGGKI
ncbi:MAG: ion transporter [Planctomycetes bacterium]|nr:ion transporter [Planctomycetota bacterium]